MAGPSDRRSRRALLQRRRPRRRATSTLRRLLAFDPARRHVLCALAPIDGAEVLVGLGAIDVGEDAPDTLVVDERFAPGWPTCSAAC